jgi:glycerophosphoryl diester phosphodiesterase
MIDFNKSLLENCIQNGPLVCAHRGIASGNIPCNTIPAFNAALLQGADMIELDVSKNRDGEFYVFHPGMEPAHLRSKRLISILSDKKVSKLRFVNQDNVPTQFGVYRLDEVLNFLKGKCYINVDKYPIDVPGISNVIRRCGVENQVIVKCNAKDKKTLEKIKNHAPDLMFMAVFHDCDEGITDSIAAQGINCIGAEVLFKKEGVQVANKAYVDIMHEKGRVVWVNSIVYDYKVVLTAGHNDDIAVSGDLENGWGWLLDKGFDIIQTDWCGMLKDYIKTRNTF